MTQKLIQRCHEFAQSGDDVGGDADSLIGFFQMFRPDGNGLAGLFDDVVCGDDLHDRLNELFAIAGDDRRPQGGRDAYFMVRKPQPITSEHAEALAVDWLGRLQELAGEVGDTQLAELLQSPPKVRVLEGKAPKNPKIEHEKCDLLKAMQVNAPALVAKITGADAHSTTLQPAYYFATCDYMVRDYLMWPLYAAAVKTIEPYGPYFRLWKHGAKYRIFGNKQVDLYLPRHA